MAILSNYKGQIDSLDYDQAKLHEIRKEIKEISFTKGSDRSKLPALQNNAKTLENRIAREDKKLLKLESAKPLQDVLSREKAKQKKRMEQKLREHMKELRNEINERNKQEVAELKRKYKDKQENRKATELRHKIIKIRDDFQDRLLRGSDRRFVPKDLVNGVIEVCNAIDPTGKKQDTQAAEKYRTGLQALSRLKLVYDRLKTNPNYDYSYEYSESFSQRIADLAQVVGNKPLRKMTLDELTDIHDVLMDISAMLKDAAQQIGLDERISNYEAGQEVIDLMDKVLEMGLTTNQIVELFGYWTLNPMRAVREMSAFDPESRLIKLFDALNEGQRKQNKFAMDARKNLEKLRSGKENEKRFNDAVEKPFDFGLKDMDGNKLLISKMQAMQFILTYYREQANENRRHLEQPVLFPDLKLQSKGKYQAAIDNGHWMPVATQDTINKILSKFDEWDNAYLKEAQHIFYEVSPDAINEISMQTRHRPIATERMYCPYETNKDYIARDSDNVKFDASIENMGMLKSLTPNANQPLIMRGLNAILDNHIDDVAKVYGMTIPIRNFNKVFNMKQTDADGGRTVKSAIRRTWKQGGIDIVDKAVADLQSPRRTESSAIVSGVKSGFVTATLASNISVWMKQAASYPTAGAVLSNTALIKGLGRYVRAKSSDVWNEIDEHTGTHWLRRQGLSIQELGEMNQSKGWQNKMNKKLGKASPMNWIQAMDVATTAALWEAAKADVESQGVKQSDASYWDKVTALYDKTIEETQPMYDSLHRAEITKNAAYKNIILFQTQPLQNSGILRESAMGVKASKKMHGKNSEQAKQASRNFRKAVSSQLASHFVFTAMTLISAALLHRMNPYRDDDKELTAESVSLEFAEQFAKNVFNAIVPVFGNYAVSAFEKIVGANNYDVLSDAVVDKVNGTIDTFAKVTKEPSFDSFLNMACEVAGYFGIPAGNAKNIVNGVILHTKDALNGEFLSFESGIERNKSQNTNRLYDAVKDGDKEEQEKVRDQFKSDDQYKSALMSTTYNFLDSGDYSTAKRVISDVISEKVKAGKTEKQARAAVRQSISAHYKQDYLDADEQERVEIRRKMYNSGVYDSVGDITKLCNNWVTKANSKK